MNYDFTHFKLADRTKGSLSQDVSAPKNEKDFPKTIEHSVWASNTIANCVCEEVKRRAVKLNMRLGCGD